MRIVTYKDTQGGTHAGVLHNDAIVSLEAFGYSDTLSLIAAGPDALPALQASLASADSIPTSTVTILAPLLNPPRIFGIGLNYIDHAAEANMPVQAVPTVFLKLSSSITGPGANIILPRNSTQVDYEAELALVIGKGGYRIQASDWQQHVFGYTIINDVSARDIQLATTQWSLGKSFPTFTPMGPCIVTADEIPNPETLDIKLRIGEETMQDANTRDLIFKIGRLIEYISAIVPLEPGDIISTGTPPGVGLGRTPKRWLASDETVTIEIEGIGTLQNITCAEGE